MVSNFIKHLYKLTRSLCPTKIGNLYSFEDTDIPKVLFTPHHLGFVTLGSEVIAVKHCVLRMTLGHCIIVATRMVEAQGCPGLVAKARKRWS
jgi:hypothetical protein